MGGLLSSGVSTEHPTSLTAADIMTTHPIVAEQNETIQTVTDLMKTNNIRHIPIVRDGEIAGIVSDRDIRSYVLPIDEELFDPEAAKVRMNASVLQVVSSDYVVFEETTPLAEIIDTMLESRIGAVPVVNQVNGKVQGIVSYIDVLKTFRELL